MTANDPTPASTSPGASVGSLSWWREVLFAAVFYGLYSAVRDLRGAKPVSAAVAFANARRVIALERWLGVFEEARVQHVFLRYRTFVEVLNDFYNTTHFVVPVVMLVALFHRAPDRYRWWRNTLAFTTALALIGFALFPLMPPRLLPPGYHFVDTLKSMGGLWSFDAGPVAQVSNQFAAMPSLHLAWAGWSAVVAASTFRRAWAKVVALAYPAATLFCIIVTANHYFLDAAAGLVTLGGGLGLCWAQRRIAARLAGRPATWPRDAATTSRARGPLRSQIEPTTHANPSL